MEIKWPRRISLTQILDQMEVNSTIFIPTNKFKPSSVRSTVFKLQKRSDKKFRLTEKGVPGINVTRIEDE